VHITSDYPNHNVIIVAEWATVKEVFEEEEKEENSGCGLEKTQEEIVKQADEGEMLLLRRILSCQKGAKDDPRENIFHSRCTIQGKVCSVIIDEESCTNVVSLSMIEKPGLQTMTHRHPYSIQWLNQSKGIQVNSRCLVSFSIGKNYQDELWCDVIDIDACHILLGRPWLYDDRVMRDGSLIHAPLPRMARRLPQPLYPHLNYYMVSSK